jgi:hypothetical protein
LLAWRGEERLGTYVRKEGEEQGTEARKRDIRVKETM